MDTQSLARLITAAGLRGSEHVSRTRRPGHAAAADGYDYGVQFKDGWVLNHWNGSTQREQAEAFIARAAKNYSTDNLELVRRIPGEHDWEPA